MFWSGRKQMVVELAGVRMNTGVGIDPMMLAVIAVIAMIVLMSLFSPKRPQQRGREQGRGGNGVGPRSCAKCGTDHPGHAVYCRRCGERL